ncbi:DUF4097 family beta strand repeat-containing protein [Streptococcus pantholopis]|uniref:DUF4097 domain-containing protein n=1 Tax=Streptococcus pantholopis TaxID=1811193 RepID=A0A172Q5E5_9STRE|nr:DUF4097 family beta strand repeat-containing protein [Streptococcus pantholopis]AND78680.1 hypothetical protein A0O21_00885 [Streptococcus pantholopis]
MVLPDFNSIKIITQFKNINIETSPDNSAHLLFDKKTNEKFDYKISNNQLLVKESSKKYSNFFANTSNSNYVTIQIPKSSIINDITIDSYISNISIKDQKLSSIKIIQDTGDITILNSNCMHGEIRTKIGDLITKNTKLSNFKININTGDWEATSLNILENVQFYANLGDLNITLSEEAAKDIKLTTSSKFGDSVIKPYIKNTSEKNHLIIRVRTGDIVVK